MPRGVRREAAQLLPEAASAGEGDEVVSSADVHTPSGAQRSLPMAERFVSLLEPLQGSLMAFCQRSIPWTSDRDDVMQTALTSAFATFHAFQEGSNFRAWIFTHLQNAVWNHCRKRAERAGSSDEQVDELPSHDGFGTLQREVAYHDLLQRPDRLYDHFDERIAAALLALPLQERTALLLRSIGEFSYRDIAAIMHCPMGTVLSQLSRARAKMRERITVASAAPPAAAEPLWQVTRQGGGT